MSPRGGTAGFITIAVGLGVMALMASMVVGCESRSTATTASSVASPATEANSSTASKSSTTTLVTTSTTIPPSGTLNGAVAGFAANVYAAWSQTFQELYPDATINYQAAPSAEAITQFTERKVDLGATDVPMTDGEIAAAEKANSAEVLHIPIFLEAIGVDYNLPGVSDLKLDPDTLAAIFLGNITQWDNPKIAALNPGLTFPALGITVVHQKYPSFDTLAFTSYLSLISMEWRSKVGVGRSVDWPVGLGVMQGSGTGPVDVIAHEAGSIGYIKRAVAVPNRIPLAELKNKSGNFITPTAADSVMAAAEGMQFPADLRLSLLDSANPQAYPVVVTAWILAYDRMTDPAKAELLKTFLAWAYGPAGDAAVVQKVGFVPLPGDLKNAALAKVGQIGP